MDIFGTAAAGLQVLQICVKTLLRFNQVAENQRDIRHIRDELVAFRNHLQMIPGPPEDGTELSAISRLSIQSLQESSEALQQDIDHFLDPKWKKRQFLRALWRGPSN